ncbi:unnamed protein product [Sphagnum jensenii]|uniref:Proteasomal ATPase second OB domain-containing protein n=1 Tax=Sphagnum jensenii TaxID=128206 RepID=A0ABP0X837_9BRYO
MSVGNLEDKIDENHAIVSSSVGPEYYVNVLSFMDKDQLEPGCAILMHNKVQSKSKNLGLEFGTCVANSTLATFLQVVGSELIQKYLGDGPSWCENSFVLLMSFPHPLSLSTKLMPLGQRDTMHTQGESERFKELCWSC